MNSIKHALANLWRFDGRDTRSQFWTYAVFVLAVVFVLNAAAMIPAMFVAFAKMQQFAQAHPEQATVTEGPGAYSIQIDGAPPEIMAGFASYAFALIAIVVVAVALIAAAVARRLHDAGRRAWWGLMPLPFLVLGMSAMPKLFASMQETDADMGLFGLLFLNNVIYMGALIALVVLLCGPTRTSPAPSAR